MKMKLEEHLRRFYNVLADEVAVWLEGEMARAAAVGVVRPVALAAGRESFAPLQEAIDMMRSKTAVTSSMRSAQWAEVPQQIRNRAQFSAGVESVKIMQDIQGRLERELEWKVGDGIGRDAFIRGVRKVMAAEGMEITPEGGLTDITSHKRLTLIHEMQTREAHNFAKWKIDQDPDLLAAAPALELIRVRTRKEPRNWAQRWGEAGGGFYNGRMIAHKLDPVWMRISRFGRPWPPFDFGSGMGVEDVLRQDAQELGVRVPAPEEELAEQRFNAKVEAEVRGVEPGKVKWLQERLGEQIAIVDGVVRLTPLNWRTVAEADAWAAQAYGMLQASAAERAVMTAYQERRTGLQERVARWLRGRMEGPADEELKGQIRLLDGVIGRSHAAANGMAYRCIDLKQTGQFKSYDWSYTSVSLCEQIAWENYGQGAEQPAIIKFYLPKGTKGVYLSQFTESNPDQGEAEFLLQRGTMLTVIDEQEVWIEGRRVKELLVELTQVKPAELDWRAPQ